MKIIIASSNPGKLRELQTFLEGLHITLIPQSEYNVREIPETGLTFVENALLKARNACQQTGLPALSDDSGLEVAALNGAPGIYSARYAGTSVAAEKHIEKLLTELKDVPEDQRIAAFHCVLVFMIHPKDPTPLICHGVWRGSVLTKPQGEGGFGYDPIFYVPTENKSAAELSLAEKNQLSHRGKALRLLLEKLPEKMLTPFQL